MGSVIEVKRKMEGARDPESGFLCTQSGAKPLAPLQRAVKERKVIVYRDVNNSRRRKSAS